MANSYRTKPTLHFCISRTNFSKTNLSQARLVNKSAMLADLSSSSSENLHIGQGHHGLSKVGTELITLEIVVNIHPSLGVHDIILVGCVEPAVVGESLEVRNIELAGADVLHVNCVVGRHRWALLHQRLVEQLWQEWVHSRWACVRVDPVFDVLAMRFADGVCSWRNTYLSNTYTLLQTTNGWDIQEFQQDY